MLATSCFNSGASTKRPALPLPGTAGRIEKGFERIERVMKKVLSLMIFLVLAISVQPNAAQAHNGAANFSSVTKASSRASDTANSQDQTTARNVSKKNKKKISDRNYRVGVGDVLDIRLATTSRESTLFRVTVLEGGLLEYPLAGEPLEVAGLTTDEIKDRLTAKIKIFDKPKITISVREYVSHTVIVTGLVNDPGSKILSREAVPLYVVLAGSQPRQEAARATIIRAGVANILIDLNDVTSTSTLIHPGDVITLSAAPPQQAQFFYIGGEVNSPGQKSFHLGLTLTQAVLASGGTSRFASNKVKISRQGQDGLLTTTEYNLKRIEEGKAPDPQLQPGDRVEIMRGRWRW